MLWDFSITIPIKPALHFLSGQGKLLTLVSMLIIPIFLCRISDDELKDKLFPGFPFIVDFLSKLVVVE